MHLLMKKIEGRWLAAVSAGPDSMALLSMCIESGMDVEAAHVNYHHRLQAEEEEQYVRSYCREHGIAVHVRNEPFAWNGNFEAAARTWRYDFFEQIVKDEGLDGVLVAHHMDDLLETYLMQKERNLVPAYYGLKEVMQYHGITVLRPLLSFRKRELQEYCDHHQIRYYIDETNLQDDNRRNYIRHHIVEKMDGSACKDLLNEIHDRNVHLQEVRNQASALLEDGRIRLSRYRNCEEEVRLTALRMLTDPGHACTLAFLKQCDDIVTGHPDFEIEINGMILACDHEAMFMSEPSAPYCFEAGNLSEVFRLGRQKYFRIESGECSVYAVTVSQDDFPLRIRNFEDGDSIEMRFGKKKVSRFFIDRHIPLYQRHSWPVVINRHGDVILVPGLGCDCRHYSIKPDFCVIQYSA